MSHLTENSDMPLRDSTQRFSHRVENYAKYRPGYPWELYDLLASEVGLQSSDQVADLGSGTGLLSQLFLNRGHIVYGVEPNTAMRAAAEQAFAGQANFISIDGRAEAITLADHSVDIVIAGQAFHWFEPIATKKEIQRILKPGKWVVLIWNRRDSSQPFARAYEQLLETYGTDYKKVDQQLLTDEKIAEFFGPHTMEKAVFPNQQTFNAEGLRGRLLSSSYTPTPDHPSYELMLAALDETFSRYQEHGVVVFHYRTDVYFGRI